MAAAVLAGTLAWGARANGDVDPQRIDPIGSWSCVLYGHPGLGNERMLFRFAANGNVDVARSNDDTFRPWAPLASWELADSTLRFSDSRTGREFEAELHRGTLGGTWRTRSLLGGWWCAGIADDFHAAFEPGVLDRPPTGRMPPLLPLVMAVPAYPRQAIREAKEGRAVACFFVDGDGMIADAELIELSDEIFRQPTLDALARSSYRSRGDALVRPGCRSYIFRLDSIRNEAQQ